MTTNIENRLAELGIKIPEAATPVANYVTTQLSGNMLFVSGQLPLIDGKPVSTGKLGTEVSLEEGKRAARACAINLLAQAQHALGNLAKIQKVVKITAFVAADPTFYDIPQVANGASDLLVEILGDAGKHTRSAVGIAVLPMNVPIEIEAIFEVK